jgi:DNA polymerase-3 subunit alpha
MQIAKDMCGFTGGEADYLRKAVGKKKMDMMKEIKPKFIDGAVKNAGAKREVMEKFWDQLEEFANYCFNKSHAACYALIAYWTAYLKAHYPSAFMAALLTSDSNNIDRLAVEIAECKKMGIKVLNPDINESYVEFGVVPETEHVRFGLAAVKGVGEKVAEVIAEERKTDGPFKSIEDYCKRVDSRLSNKRVWENLIKTGAFDHFGDRSDLLYSIDAISEFASKTQKEAASNQVDLFSLLGDVTTPDGALATVKVAEAPSKYSDKEKLAWERELLGLYISGHPLDQFAEHFDESSEALDKITPERNGQKVVVSGLVSSVRQILTKRGDRMAFLAIEDKTGESEVIIFPKVYAGIASGLEQDAFVKISGKISGTDASGHPITDAKIIADQIEIVGD